MIIQTIKYKTNYKKGSYYLKIREYSSIPAKSSINLDLLLETINSAEVPPVNLVKVTKQTYNLIFYMGTESYVLETHNKIVGQGYLSTLENNTLEDDVSHIIINFKIVISSGGTRYRSLQDQKDLQVFITSLNFLKGNDLNKLKSFKELPRIKSWLDMVSKTCTNMLTYYDYCDSRHTDVSYMKHHCKLIIEKINSIFFKKKNVTLNMSHANLNGNHLSMNFNDWTFINIDKNAFIERCEMEKKVALERKTLQEEKAKAMKEAEESKTKELLAEKALKETKAKALSEAKALKKREQANLKESKALGIRQI
jgi:hypothetical protein